MQNGARQLKKWLKSIRCLIVQENNADKGKTLLQIRYHNHLDSTILRTEWTTEEEQHLYRLHDDIGNKWAIIAQKLPGR